MVPFVFFVIIHAVTVIERKVLNPCVKLTDMRWEGDKNSVSIDVNVFDNSTFRRWELNI